MRCVQSLSTWQKGKLGVRAENSYIVLKTNRISNPTIWQRFVNRRQATW